MGHRLAHQQFRLKLVCEACMEPVGDGEHEGEQGQEALCFGELLPASCAHGGSSCVTSSSSKGLGPRGSKGGRNSGRAVGAQVHGESQAALQTPALHLAALCRLCCGQASVMDGNAAPRAQGAWQTWVVTRSVVLSSPLLCCFLASDKHLSAPRRRGWSLPLPAKGNAAILS